MYKKTIVGAAIALALTAPAGAFAKGGGGGGGGEVTPPAADAPCAELTATNSGVIDKPASRKPITIDFLIANCSRHTETLRTTMFHTGYSITSSDPFVQETCTSTPVTANTITLKPGEKRSFDASSFPRCFVNWGLDGRNYIYEATTTDTASGAVVATAESMVLNRGGV